MKGKMLSQYVRELQELLDTEGDMVCIYAKDDEGNGYSTVCYEPSIMFAENSDMFCTEFYSEEDIEDDDELDVSNLIKVVCIN